jgi:hypothetical protein
LQSHGFELTSTEGRACGLPCYVAGNQGGQLRIDQARKFQCPVFAPMFCGEIRGGSLVSSSREGGHPRCVDDAESVARVRFRGSAKLVFDFWALDVSTRQASQLCRRRIQRFNKGRWVFYDSSFKVEASHVWRQTPMREPQAGRAASHVWRQIPVREPRARSLTRISRSIVRERARRIVQGTGQCT